MFSSKAMETRYGREHKNSATGFSTSTQEIKAFSDFFSERLSEYLECRNQKEKINCARLLSIWISKAYADGFIIEGTGLLKKFDECRSRNAQLEKDLQILSAKYSELAQKYKNLETEHKQFTSRFQGPLKKS
jgi:uncharacterized protein YlxW (UPF0749 family)